MNKNLFILIIIIHIKKFKFKKKWKNMKIIPRKILTWMKAWQLYQKLGYYNIKGTTIWLGFLKIYKILKQKLMNQKQKIKT